MLTPSLVFAYWMRGSMSDTSGHLEFDALQDTWDCFTTGSDTLPVGSYTHVVATYDKNKQEMRIYLNGSLRATCGGVTSMGGSFSAPLLLGYLSTNTWSGSMDEVACYGYALRRSRRTTATPARTATTVCTA